MIVVGAFMHAAAMAQGASVYKGGGKCEGAKVEVAFKYDAQAATVTDFEASHACAAGQGKGIEWAAKGPLKVEKDGRFQHKDKYGNSVKGSISRAGQATGELSRPPFKLACGASGSPSACTQWHASRGK